MSKRRNTHTLRKMAIALIEVQACEAGNAMDADFTEKAMENIYSWAHVANGGCIHHKDWEDELAETYEKCQEAGLFK